jgi:predicted negative regulator of RcsB-dependent stress response|tara:strand:- start:1634 stop:2278 length:645 start_codon:yes stop_codon:yes gene_type:complete
MDEELSIIDTNTRNEKIKNFFVSNRKIIIISISLIILIIIAFFGFGEFKSKQKIKISNLYNSIIVDHEDVNKDKTLKSLIDIINKKDNTYSPLALYFILDNKLSNDKNQINELFDIIINEVSLEKEIKNLIIYKKALYNADSINENELLNTLNPLINSESIWKSHALYLVAEYFYSKNEKQKSIEFFNQIINSENSNQDLVKESKKRLNRDLSD